MTIMHDVRFYNPISPLLSLLDPRRHMAGLLVTLFVGLGAAFAGVQLLKLPLWVASASVLGLVLLASVPKWREDGRLYGRTAMVLCVLVMAQAFHTFEHASQWIQFHVMGWPAAQSSGLISAADSEWVHFGWNWLVLLTIIYLIYGGMRNVWVWLLVIWAAAHTFEHSYMMLRYLQTLQELSALGVSNVAAQGLPGILGRDGWLASSSVTQNTFLCRLPGFTTAPRIDVHFWWNNGEVLFLLPAANSYMAQLVHSSKRRTWRERVYAR